MNRIFKHCFLLLLFLFRLILQLISLLPVAHKWRRSPRTLASWSLRMTFTCLEVVLFRQHSAFLCGRNGRARDHQQHLQHVTV
jgi:hypothetical protein